MPDDLEAKRRRIELARSRFEDGDADVGLPGDVVSSWQRCRAEVATDSVTGDVLEHADDAWAESPVRAAGRLVDELGALADEEDYLAAITDARGRLLWTHGSASMRRAAERANFVPGADWSETRAGTNAPGLAVTNDRPATVFSVEHWCEPVHDWVCYAAPVHDANGAVVGSIDLSSRWRRANAMAATTVRAMAQLMDQRLASVAPAAVAGLHLDLLGAPSVRLDGRRLALPLRQIEILAVLALEGACTLDQLQAHVYGDHPVSPTTVKAEISHLRRTLGGAIGSRPYRLTVPVTVDVHDVRTAIRSGEVADAATAYSGQLLVSSESPLLTDERHHLDVALRTALLAAGRAADLVRFARVHPYDREVLEVAQTRASADDPCRPDLAAALARLDR